MKNSFSSTLCFDKHFLSFSGNKVFVFCCYIFVFCCYIFVFCCYIFSSLQVVLFDRHEKNECNIIIIITDYLWHPVS